MQLYYSDRYEPKFCDAVKALNSLEPDKSMRQIVEELYVSPKVKRPIYQSLLILKEIEKIEKCPPKKIFIEVARGDEKKEPKASRKDRLIELYKNCKKDNEELYLGLLDKEEDALRSDKLYLYYTQMGKCMYTGENIELDELMGSNSRWDIDHIFPRSKIKDDSLNNRVLVKKTVNSSKTNDYPISGSIQAQMGSFWNMLLSKKLISNEKHQRLVRKEALRDDELKAFISRQLVETRQSTKAVANILEQLYPHSEIVYVKAALASDFRKDRDMLKCREVNDFHHAKDAYLNIVVGNVYTVKFSHFSHNYSLNRMFDFNIKGAWTADNDQSLNIVKNTMAKNNIRYTRYAFEKQGGFYKQTIRKKGQAQVPVKNKGAVIDKEKYGGYSELSSTYFCCAEHGKPNNRIRSLFAVELIYKNKYEQNPTAFLKERYNLINPEIIVQKIKTQACISFDNFRTHLGGKDSGGKVVAYRPAIQLVLSYNDTKYIRNIAKYLSESSTREINKFDNITKEDNQQLYLQLTEKLRNKIFNVMFSDLQKKLADAYDKFTNLAIADQCYIIAEILKILHNNAMSGNLKLIGISSNGRIRLNNNISKISKFSSVKLINQSVTGLFEQEIELLK